MDDKNEWIINVIGFIIVISILATTAWLGMSISDNKNKPILNTNNNTSYPIRFGTPVYAQTPTPYPDGTWVMLTGGPDCFEKLKIINHIDTDEGYYYKYKPECEKNVMWYHINEYHKAGSITIWNDKVDAICPCGGNVSGDPMYEN